MLLFQRLQCRAVALRELFDVRIDARGIFLCQHHFRSGIHAIQFFPFQKTFVGACQMISGNVSFIGLAADLCRHFFPDLIVLIHGHIQDLHHLSAGCGACDRTAVIRFRADRQLITQIDQCHDFPFFHDLLQCFRGLVDPRLIFLVQCMGPVSIALVGKYECRQENGSQKC